MSDYTPTQLDLRTAYARANRDTAGIAEAQDEFDRAIAKVRAEAKVEALDALGVELFDRNKKARTAPNMTQYQRGRADSYEASYALADRRAIAIRNAS